MYKLVVAVGKACLIIKLTTKKPQNIGHVTLFARDAVIDSSTPRKCDETPAIVIDLRRGFVPPSASTVGELWFQIPPVLHR
jgi:hypothetical protein